MQKTSNQDFRRHVEFTSSGLTWWCNSLFLLTLRKVDVSHDSHQETLPPRFQMSSSAVTKMKMNNGLEIPAIGIGTYLGQFTDEQMIEENKRLSAVVEKSIGLGYRLIDTAQVYNTEKGIGDGLKKVFDGGLVRREDVFVSTKVWNTHHRREEVKEALEKSLNNLGLEYVDLYLMHWPMAVNDNYSYSDTDYLETWKAMESLHLQGLARSIGLSNFNRSQVDRVLRECSVKPAVLQIEIHPQNVQEELVSYAQENRLLVMAYSPFGSLVSRYGIHMERPRIDDPVLTEIGTKYRKSTTQVVLRWLVDRNIIPIPKSTNITRLAANLDIFDFKLTQQEIAKISAFDRKTRFTLPSFWQDHIYYPFEKVDNHVANPFN